MRVPGCYAELIERESERKELEAAVLLGLGRLADAKELLEALVRENPDNWAFWCQWGSCVMPKGAAMVRPPHR